MKLVLLKIKNGSINAFLLFVSLAVLFALAEITFRLFAEDATQDSPVNREWFAKYVTYNSHGFRDRKYAYKKPDHTFRILVLGDSQTFGHGIKNLEDTWHKQLERLLNEGFNTAKFQVISLANEGWSTGTQLYALYEEGYRYDPDLILVSYYPNDVPEPANFHCQGDDADILQSKKWLKILGVESKAYDFLNFRLNRLWELMEWKPRYQECLNRRFDSRGWEIQKIYLDSILLSARIHNVYFMMSLIPILSDLSSNYPLKRQHLKLMGYCRKMNIECVDLYEETFKNLDADRLIISRKDRHLNEKGAELIAQTLYKKLKPLKSFQHPSWFRGIFELQEILDQKEILQRLDDRLLKLVKNIDSFSIKKNKETVTAKKTNSALFFQRAFYNPYSTKPKKTIETVWNSSQDLSEFKKRFWNSSNERKLLFEETIKKQNNVFEFSRSLRKKNSPNWLFENNKTFFTFSTKILSEAGMGNPVRRLFIEKDIPFFDPTIYEPLLFKILHASTTQQISEKLGFYLRYGWTDYLKSLSQEMILYNPSSGTKEALSKLAFIIQKTERIKRDYPEFLSRHYLAPLKTAFINAKTKTYIIE